MNHLKLATSVLSVAVMTSLFAPAAFAQGTERVTMTHTIAQQKALSSAKKLKKSDVLAIVQSNIEGYLKTDEQTVTDGSLSQLGVDERVLIIGFISMPWQMVGYKVD